MREREYISGWPIGFPVTVLERRADLAEKVGLVIDRWGLIERALWKTLALASGASEKEAFEKFIAPKNFRAGLGRVRDACTAIPATEDKVELEAIFDELAEKYNDRNAIVHGAYLGQDLVEVLLPRVGSAESIRLDETQIEDHLDQLNDLFARLISFALSDTEYPCKRNVVWR